MASFYHHPSFIRGQRHLVSTMVRCKVKGTGPKRLSISTSTDEVDMPPFKRSRKVSVSSNTGTDSSYNASVKLEDCPYSPAITPIVVSPTFTSSASPGPRSRNRTALPPPPLLLSPKRSSSGTKKATRKKPMQKIGRMKPTQDEIESDMRKNASEDSLIYHLGLDRNNCIRLEDGDLLFFEGHPFHYLDFLPQPNETLTGVCNKSTSLSSVSCSPLSSHVTVVADEPWQSTPSSFGIRPSKAAATAVMLVESMMTTIPP